MKNIRTRALGNSFWNIISEGIGKGAIFITNVYLARVLLADGFGALVIAQSIVLYFSLAADLGISMYGVREVARQQSVTDVSAIVSPLITFRLFLGLLTFAFYLGWLLFFTHEFINNVSLFVAAGLYLLTFSASLDWVLRGIERFKILAIANLLGAACLLSLSIFFVNSSDDAYIAALLWSLSFLAPYWIQLRNLKKIGIHIKLTFAPRIVLSHVRTSIIFTLSGAFAAAYFYLPLFIAGALFTNSETGIFAAPYRLISTLSSPGFFIASAFYPILSELFIRDRRKFKVVSHKLSGIMLLIGIVPALLCFYYGTEIITILFGQAYLAGIPTLQHLAWLLPLTFVRYRFTMSLLASNLQHRQIPCFLIAGVAQLGLLLSQQEIVAHTLAHAAVWGELVLIICLLIANRPASTLKTEIGELPNS